MSKKNRNVSDETIENLKTSYNEFLTENPVEDIEDKTLKISVYAADGRTVKTGISVDENEAYVALENNETESTIIFYSTEPKSETNDVGTTTTTILKNTFANNSGELSYEITTEYNKDDIETLQKEYDSKFADFTTSYSTDYSELYKDSTQKYIIKTTKNNESTITGTVELEGEDLDAIKEMVNIKFKCQFGNATVNKINETNADVINDFTMEEYQKLLVDIVSEKDYDKYIRQVAKNAGVSEDLVRFIIMSEGEAGTCKAKLGAYKCSSGQWTIGFGHTNNCRNDDEVFGAGKKITLKEAFQLLEDDLKEIKIPSATQGIDNLAFEERKNIESIIIDDSNAIYSSYNSINGNCIVEKSTYTLIIGCKSTSAPYVYAQFLYMIKKTPPIL